MIAVRDLIARRIIPVVVINDPSKARPLADALVAGGLPIVEVTLRSSNALEALREFATMPGMVVGGGTVINEAQVDAVADTGASFVVSPGLSPAVVRRCQHHGLPILAGVANPTDVMAALDLGLTVMKFFPAEPSGGCAALQALAGPFPQVRFVPTGGISFANVRDYLALPTVAAVGGSWMVSPALIEQGDFTTITALTHDAVALVESLRTEGLR